MSKTDIAIRNVCGLHCEDNLQSLTFRVNASKGNRYWSSM